MTYLQGLLTTGYRMLACKAAEKAAFGGWPLRKFLWDRIDLQHQFARRSLFLETRFEFYDL